MRVAFIFDDGPHKEHTPVILHAFARQGGHATFSLIGKHVDAEPSLAREYVRAGHELMNHSYTHPNLTECTDDEVTVEIEKNQQTIFHATGTFPTHFWPPYLACDERVETLIAGNGLKLFKPDRFRFIDTKDWDERNADYSEVLSIPGEDRRDVVVLMHEWPRRTAETIDKILDQLAQTATCRFVTLTELLNGK